MEGFQIRNAKREINEALLREKITIIKLESKMIYVFEFECMIGKSLQSIICNRIAKRKIEVDGLDCSWQILEKTDNALICYVGAFREIKIDFFNINILLEKLSKIKELCIITFFVEARQIYRSKV